MSIDWTPVAQAGVGALALVIPAGALYLATWLRSRGQQRLADAVQTGGGVAYDSMVAATRNGSIDMNAARAVAMQEGIAAVNQLATKEAAALGAAATQTLVKGALGDRLASDPTVNVGGASTATATAGPGETATATAGVPVHVVGDDAKLVRNVTPIAALLAAGLALSACTVAQTGTALNDVRLFCATKDAVVAVATVTGTPVLAMGQSKAYVDGACALVAGKPVALPVGAGQVATVAVTPVRESGL